MGLSDLFLRPRLEAVVREHGPHVRGLLYRLFGPDAEIDDVFQDVFIEVLRSLPTFAGRAKLRTWIHRVALNVAYQEMRRRSHAARRTSEPHGGAGAHGAGRADALVDALVDHHGDDGDHGTQGAHGTSDVHADVERKEAARRVHAALACLPPKQRLAVALHDLQGMTLREIAEDAGLPLQTVATQVRAGRERLAQALADLRADRTPPRFADVEEEP